ncbi:MAG TPA: inorganic diphosphatase [Nitriliruptorales bacterium]|nr:inorganic diphosphatase [Nitriliruptorales bacterium]
MRVPDDGAPPEAQTQGAEGDRPSAFDGRVDVFVEVPMGSRNKYEFDKEAGRFRLDRMLFSAVRYPGDYGYIPETLAEDGDPLDAIVILGEPTFPGCLITGRVVGVMHMTDEAGPDAKILAVPDSDPRWRHVEELTDVPDHLLDEIRHFFSIYKDLEQKLVTVRGWSDRSDALQEVKESRERFHAG